MAICSNAVLTILNVRALAIQTLKQIYAVNESIMLEEKYMKLIHKIHLENTKQLLKLKCLLFVIYSLIWFAVNLVTYMFYLFFYFFLKAFRVFKDCEGRKITINQLNKRFFDF